MSQNEVNADTLRTLRHDIRNQLSNIHLALETLKYEVNQQSEDITYCFDTIYNSAAKINELLKDAE